MIEEIPESQNKNGIPFKEFLDKSTNLLTVFGVLNALVIYSSDVVNSDLGIVLSLCFFTLSLLVWFEIFWLAIDSNNGSPKYQIFEAIAMLIQVMLIWYFVTEFKAFVTIVCLFGLLLLMIYVIGQLLLRLVGRLILKQRFISKQALKQNAKWLVLLVMLISIGLSGLLFRLLIPFAKPVLDRLLS